MTPHEQTAFRAMRDALSSISERRGSAMRTWSARIEARTGRAVVTLDAKPSASDLLRDQIVSAVRESSPILADDTDVHVLIFKTTAAHGTTLDRSFSVFRDRRGEVRYQ